MKKNLKFVLKYLFLVGIILILSGCGTPKYVGTWYPSEEPDGDVLIITEDDSFVYGDVHGNVTESDGIIYLLIDSNWYEKVYIDNYNGIDCLIDDDGMIWTKDYETAYEIMQQFE